MWYFELEELYVLINFARGILHCELLDKKQWAHSITTEKAKRERIVFKGKATVHTRRGYCSLSAYCSAYLHATIRSHMFWFPPQAKQLKEGMDTWWKGRRLITALRCLTCTRVRPLGAEEVLTRLGEKKRHILHSSHSTHTFYHFTLHFFPPLTIIPVVMSVLIWQHRVSLAKGISCSISQSGSCSTSRVLWYLHTEVIGAGDVQIHLQCSLFSCSNTRLHMLFKTQILKISIKETFADTCKEAKHFQNHPLISQRHPPDAVEADEVREPTGTLAARGGE